jgi:hypothetical protein
MEIRVWRFQNCRDCRYTCNPHKFEIPALPFPCKVPAIPCKHLQCKYYDVYPSPQIFGPSTSTEVQAISTYYPIEKCPLCMFRKSTEGLSEQGLLGVPWYPQNLTDQLPLSQTSGRLCPLNITYPPNFKTFLRPYKVHISSSIGSTLRENHLQCSISLKQVKKRTEARAL